MKAVSAAVYSSTDAGWAETTLLASPGAPGCTVRTGAGAELDDAGVTGGCGCAGGAAGAADRHAAPRETRNKTRALTVRCDFDITNSEEYTAID